MRFIRRFYWILERKGYPEKMNNLPKHHGARPNAAASVEAGPDGTHYSAVSSNAETSAKCQLSTAWWND